MGEDKDIVVLSFSVKSQEPANDLMNFLEKGYTINWSEQVFTITKVKQRLGVCWYQISDQSGKIYPKLKYYYDLRLVSDD